MDENDLAKNLGLCHTYHIQQGSKPFFSPEKEYSDLESSGQKIEMAATALENQKLEKVLYTYKQVGGLARACHACQGVIFEKIFSLPVLPTIRITQVVQKIADLNQETILKSCR